MPESVPLGSSTDSSTDFDALVAQATVRSEKLPPIEQTPKQARGTMVLVDQRSLIRDCLTRCLQLSTQGGVLGIETVNDLAGIDESIHISVVVLAIIEGSTLPQSLDELSAILDARGGPKIPVVVMCDADDPEQIMSAMATGARGFIPTTTDLDVAIEAIRLVRAGGSFIPTSILKAARGRSQNAGSGSGSGSFTSDSVGRRSIFTARQAAVVDALRRGKANKTIAYELNMRESTVKVHVRNIMKKLNAKNRTEVAYLATKLMSGD